MLSLEAFLERLSGAQRAGVQYKACCPGHADDRQSLAVRYSRGRIVLHCHAGCSFEHVIAAMHLQPGDVCPERRNGVSQQRVIVAKYDYVDEAGSLQFQVCRFDPKDFRQRRQMNGQWIWDLQGVVVVPYNLPAVVKAVAANHPVWIVEGEKDAAALGALGCTATCNAGGAGKWRSEFARWFHGANVILVPDNDEPGRRHMISVACSLLGIAKRMRRIELPDLDEHGDFSDWLGAQGKVAKEEIVARMKPLLQQAEELEREPLSVHRARFQSGLVAAGKRMIELGEDPFLSEGELRRYVSRLVRPLLWQNENKED